MEIRISPEVKAAAPGLKILKIVASVCNPSTPDSLWEKLLDEGEKIKNSYEISEIKNRPGILATRKAYKAMGKDPNRYRPSAEALTRRFINGKGLYRLSVLVDIINLISLITGYSIGGFDRDHINGDKLTLSIGTKEDIFNAIGRGVLNIEGLPVYRDNVGGIGTPTSDEERTRLRDETKNLLMLVNIYEEDMTIEDTVSLIKDLLEEFAEMSSFSYEIID